MDRMIKHRHLTTAIRIIYGLFLFGTGFMTLGAAIAGIEGDPTNPAIIFLNAVRDTGYLFHWVGIFKIIAGSLILIPRTAHLGVMIACPYSFNILLWVTFVARQWFFLGVADFMANAYLVYAFFNRYKPLFRNTE